MSSMPSSKNQLLLSSIRRGVPGIIVGESSDTKGIVEQIRKELVDVWVA